MERFATLRAFQLIRSTVFVVVEHTPDHFGAGYTASGGLRIHEVAHLPVYFRCHREVA
jgi:hypothetical protein